MSRIIWGRSHILPFQPSMLHHWKSLLLDFRNAAFVMCTNLKTFCHGESVTKQVVCLFFDISTLQFDNYLNTHYQWVYLLMSSMFLAQTLSCCLRQSYFRKYLTHCVMHDTYRSTECNFLIDALKITSHIALLVAISEVLDLIAIFRFFQSAINEESKTAECSQRK